MILGLPKIYGFELFILEVVVEENNNSTAENIKFLCLFIISTFHTNIYVLIGLKKNV